VNGLKLRLLSESHLSPSFLVEICTDDADFTDWSGMDERDLALRNPLIHLICDSDDDSDFTDGSSSDTSDSPPCNPLIRLIRDSDNDADCTDSRDFSLCNPLIRLIRDSDICFLFF